MIWADLCFKIVTFQSFGRKIVKYIRFFFENSYVFGRSSFFGFRHFSHLRKWEIYLLGTPLMMFFLLLLGHGLQLGLAQWQCPIHTRLRSISMEFQYGSMGLGSTLEGWVFEPNTAPSTSIPVAVEDKSSILVSNSFEHIRFHMVSKLVNVSTQLVFETLSSATMWWNLATLAVGHELEGSARGVKIISYIRWEWQCQIIEHYM